MVRLSCYSNSAISDAGSAGPLRDKSQCYSETRFVVRAGPEVRVNAQTT